MREGIWNPELELDLRDGSCVSGVMCREWLWCVFVDLRHDRSGGGTRGWEGGGI